MTSWGTYPIRRTALAGLSFSLLEHISSFSRFFLAAHLCDISVAAHSPGIHVQRAGKIIVHSGAPKREGKASLMLLFNTTQSLNFSRRHEIQISC